jgi:hypothetical protein
MPDSKCDTCVECFKKHKNPGLQKESCGDYMPSLEKALASKKSSTYVFEGSQQ